MPAGGSCCNRLKSLISRFLAGVDILNPYLFRRAQPNLLSNIHIRDSFISIKMLSLYLPIEIAKVGSTTKEGTNSRPFFILTKGLRPTIISL